MLKLTTQKRTGEDARRSTDFFSSLSLRGDLGYVAIKGFLNVVFRAVAY
jgi:hypothetical protein